MHLQTLLGARDPFIRVAGAVYLTFEDRELGMSKLEDLTKLPADPGAWAALNLARRGHKPSVSRALELFASSGQRGHMSGVPHENLQLRLLVLLSNSAAKSGVAQPNPTMQEPRFDADEQTMKKYQESLRKYYLDWWSENQSKIQMHDPWLKALEAKKVD